MKHYILDAHNVIHKDEALRSALRLSAGNARSSLVKLVQLFARRYKSYSFTLVFDGSPTDLPPMPPAIKAVFSGSGRTADEVIKEMIRNESKPALCVVVSSDHEVFNYGKINACECHTSEEFLREIKTVQSTGISGKGPGKSSPKPGEKPTHASKKDIDEMKKLFGLE